MKTLHPSFHHHLGALVLSGLLLCSTAPAADQTATWNGTTGNWTDFTRWSTNPLFPNNGNGGFNFDAVQNGGTVTVDQVIDIDAYTLSGFAVNTGGAGTLNLSGLFTWSSGTINGTGELNANAGIDMSGIVGRGITDRTINTAGTTTWASSGFGFGLNGSASINNNGTWNVTGGQSMSGGIFNNMGQFNKSAGDPTVIATRFNNTATGLVTLSNATTLNLNGTGTNAHAGTFDIGAGSTLIFNIGSNSATDIHQLNEGVAFTGSGTLDNRGRLVANTDVEIAPTFVMKGTISGPGAITTTGTASWEGATLMGANAATDVLNTNNTLNIIAGGGLNGRTLNTSATTNWSTVGFSLGLSNGAVINNLASGVWNVTGSQSMSGGTFNNHGVFNKSAGDPTVIATRFNNTATGAVTLSNATTLNLNGTGTNAHAGTFDIGAGSTLIFNIGSNSATDIHQLNEGVAFTGSGTLDNRGNLVANTDVEIAPTFVMKGTISGPGAITTTGIASWENATIKGTNPATDVFSTNNTLNINSGSLNGRTLNTGATTNWTGGGILTSNGAIINNLADGTWNVTVDGQFIQFGTFNNMGEFNKSAGATTSLANTTFNNTGTVNVGSGSGTGLTLNGPITQHVGTTLTGGTWNVSNGSSLTFSTGSNITTNQGSVMLDGPGSSFAKVTTALNDNQGSFTLKNDRDLTTAGAYANSGTTRVEDSTTVMTIGSGGSAAYTQTAGETELVGGALIDASVFNLNGGELKGNGTIASSVITGGTQTIAPGLSPGVLTIDGDLMLSAGSTLAMEIGGLGQGTDYDFLDVNGTLTLAGILDLDLINGFEDLVQANDVFILATADSAILGAFSNVASGSRVWTNTNVSFDVWYGAGSIFDPNSLVVTGAPEPTRGILLLLGLGGVILRRRRSSAA